MRALPLILALLALALAPACRRPKPPPPGSGSGSPVVAGSDRNAGSGSASAGSGSPTIRVELKPPRADMSTPQATWRAARRYTEKQRLDKLFQLGLQPDLQIVAWAMHQQIGHAIKKLHEAQDIIKAREAYEEYAELVREHGVHYERAYGDRLDHLYANAQINILLADMVSFTRKLPMVDRSGRSFYDSVLLGTDSKLSKVEIKGTRALAQAGKAVVRFRLLFGRWFILFGPEQPAGSGSGR